MFDDLEANEELRRVDEDSMPDKLRVYETPDGFQVGLVRNPESGNVLVKLWDNVEEAWRRDADDLLARGDWMPVDRAEGVAKDMIEMREILQEINESDDQVNEPSTATGGV